MLNKKEKERLALNKYLEASEQFFEFDDFESPDLILNVNGKLIGCEVTEFYPDYGSKGSELRKRENHLNKLHHELRSRLLEKYPTGFSFSVSYKQNFSGKTPIRLEVEKAIGKLQYLNDYKKVDEPTVNIRQIFIRNIGYLPSRISLMIFTDYQEPKIDWFEPIIESKSTLLQNWKGNYAQNWLLISIGLSRSGDVTLNKIKNLKNLNTKDWDKIILIDVSFNDYVEINAT